MNPNISSLAQHPRGKAFRSRLVVHDADIWRWLAAGETYRQITQRVAELGLKISLAAVHNYVAVRLRRRNSLNHLPGPSLRDAGESMGALKAPPPAPCQSEHQSTATATMPFAVHEYVFTPPSSTDIQLQDADLALNDPTALYS